ncbi:hypothetical protein, partial [Mitsuokella jalaludinii]|uniref:hypothetical protein n=1 Tax=Mitsuokella jalaludinii TaxID=187979 RepID=UPI003077A50C
VDICLVVVVVAVRHDMDTFYIFTIYGCESSITIYVIYVMRKSHVISARAAQSPAASAKS